MWAEAATKAGIDTGPRTAFHILRHTWATWLLRYQGLDTRGLTDTGAWASPRMAERYAHTIASEAAMAATNLPTRVKSV